jgi:hypothetical protein
MCFTVLPRACRVPYCVCRQNMGSIRLTSGNSFRPTEHCGNITLFFSESLPRFHILTSTHRQRCLAVQAHACTPLSAGRRAQRKLRRQGHFQQRIQSVRSNSPSAAPAGILQEAAAGRRKILFAAVCIGTDQKCCRPFRCQCGRTDSSGSHRDSGFFFTDPHITHTRTRFRQQADETDAAFPRRLARDGKKSGTVSRKPRGNTHV